MDFKLTTLKPFHANWLPGAFDRVRNNSVAIERAWERTGIRAVAEKAHRCLSEVSSDKIPQMQVFIPPNHTSIDSVPSLALALQTQLPPVLNEDEQMDLTRRQTSYATFFPEGWWTSISTSGNDKANIHHEGGSPSHHYRPSNSGGNMLDKTTDSRAISIPVLKFKQLGPNTPPDIIRHIFFRKVGGRASVHQGTTKRISTMRAEVPATITDLQIRRATSLTKQQTRGPSPFLFLSLNSESGEEADQDEVTVPRTLAQPRQTRLANQGAVYPDQDVFSDYPTCPDHSDAGEEERPLMCHDADVPKPRRQRRRPTETHWSNPSTINRYTDKIIIPVPYVTVQRKALGLPDQPAFAIFGVCKAHRCPALLQKLKDSYLPGVRARELYGGTPAAGLQRGRQDLAAGGRLEQFSISVSPELWLRWQQERFVKRIKFLHKWQAGPLCIVNAQFQGHKDFEVNYLNFCKYVDWTMAMRMVGRSIFMLGRIPIRTAPGREVQYASGSTDGASAGPRSINMPPVQTSTPRPSTSLSDSRDSGPDFSLLAGRSLKHGTPTAPFASNPDRAYVMLLRWLALPYMKICIKNGERRYICGEVDLRRK
uniref:Uncharacterized protein n=1 Tax=Branchiostoma floridae TaxID=7739 RepID=C3YSX6_BRAFL|eukprot:XP_002600628.1 hypothetical protein BRAFLDRAFT_95142 [Branchiostoma floridae]